MLYLELLSLLVFSEEDPYNQSVVYKENIFKGKVSGFLVQFSANNLFFFL